MTDLNDRQIEIARAADDAVEALLQPHDHQQPDDIRAIVDAWQTAAEAHRQANPPAVTIAYAEVAKALRVIIDTVKTDASDAEYAAMFAGHTALTNLDEVLEAQHG